MGAVFVAKAEMQSLLLKIVNSQSKLWRMIISLIINSLYSVWTFQVFVYGDIALVQNSVLT